MSPLLSHTETTKVVRIQDRALGLTALVLKVVILIFIAGFLFFHETGYLDYEPVVGTATGQLIGSVEGMNVSTLPYCQGETPCRFIDMYTIVAPGDLTLHPSLNPKPRLRPVEHTP